MKEIHHGINMNAACSLVKREQENFAAKMPKAQAFACILIKFDMLATQICHI